MLVLTNMVFIVEYDKDFGKIMDGLTLQILMDGFSGILYLGWVEDVQTMKDKLINGKKIVSRFKGKIVKMIKDAGSKFDDYSISPKNFWH